MKRLSLKKSNKIWQVCWILLPLPLYPLPFTLYFLPFTQLSAQAQTKQDSKAEAARLLQRGIQLYRASQYQAAIKSLQQARTLYQEIRDRNGEADALGGLGEVFRSLGQYSKAIDFFQQSFVLSRSSGDLARAADSLRSLGNVYIFLGQYSKAISFHEQSLLVARNNEDLKRQASALTNLGLAYSHLGYYPKQIEVYQQALAIYRNTTEQEGEAVTLGNLGSVYLTLKQYLKAIEFYKQSLIVFRAINDKRGQAGALQDLGNAYDASEQPRKALEFYQQAIALYQEIGDLDGQINVLGGFSKAYHQLKQYTKAVEVLQQSLVLSRHIGNRREEAKILNDLGYTYLLQRQFPKAVEFYQKSLSIFQDIGDRESESNTFSDIGHMLEVQNQPELSIVFYKRSVNVREEIRQDLQSLRRELQQSYTQTVAYTYRELADLLLSQGRLAEAQRVLELLKLQELKEFTRSRPVEGKQEIALLQLEQQILQQYGGLIAFGRRLNECEQTGKSCSDLRDQLDQLTLAFNRESNTFTKTLRERLAQDPAFLTSDQLGSTATSIVTAKTGTVLIYPLLLDTKLRLLLATRAGEKGVVFRTVEVPNAGQQQVWKMVSRFRDLLQSSSSDLKELQQVSTQLYDWLIRPLESELSQGQVQHLVFALDRATRYIPMAALFDRQGNQYLVQKYAVSTILAAELTNTRDRLPADANQISVLALGVSKPTDGFNALPNVPTELKAIVRDSRLQFQGIYRGSGFLDEEFDYTAFRDNLSNHQIVHIATHGKFEPGRPENSFILPGKGNRLTIEEIQKLGNYMRDVHLVVLSACQTAIGGPDESGIEIPGIGFYFLKNQVETVIASLWQVNDSSTSLLMQQFYQNLATGKMTKTEALQQAQRSLLQDGGQASEGDRGFRIEPTQPGNPALITRNLSHPYYWAPFILIGNGL